MLDQLLGWLALVDVVLLAATRYLDHLSAFLKALAGVVTSARAFWRAIRPAKRVSAEPCRKVVKVGRRCRITRPGANNRT